MRRRELLSEEVAPLRSCVVDLQQQIALARLAIGTGDKNRAVAHLQNAQVHANTVENHLASFAGD